MNRKTTCLILCLLLIALFIATNALGAPKPKRGVQVTPKSAPALDSLYQNSYAVIIGINHYDKWPSLEYAVNDAKAIEKRLKDLGFETTTLIEHSATRGNIVRILGDVLPRKVENNDRVVIFFAGHGQTEELADGSQMGYIVPVDADTRDLYSTAISMDQVRNFSKRLKAKHVLYLMDSCYSGLGLTRSGAIPPSERDYLRKITTRKAHQMLTAGSKGEQSQEEGAHGVFTKYVLEALDGAADRDEKGYITFSDMASYVKPKVSRYTGTKQVPQYGSIDGEGEFVFVLAGLSAAVQPDPSGLEKERQRLAEEKERLEAERRSLATQQAQMEEQKRLAEERRRLEEEKKRIAEEQASLREDKEAKKTKTRGWMGISVQDVTEDIAKSLKLSQRGGAMISEVFKGEPADKAGLRPGDVIIEVNGKGIKDTRVLLILLASFHENEKVQVKVLRDGQKEAYLVAMSAISKHPATPMMSEIGRDGRFIAHDNGTIIAGDLKVGGRAAGFNLKDSEGVEYTLDSPQYKGKVVVVFYNDPGSADLNNELQNALIAARDSGKIDKTFYQGLGIANVSDSMVPNFLIRSGIKRRQEKSKSVILIDPDYTLLNLWGLTSKTSNIIMLDKQRICRYLYKGKVPAADVEKVIALIQEYQEK
jgi:uncharacterized caspase-like protein/predicted transcriptional regulator